MAGQELVGHALFGEMKRVLLKYRCLQDMVAASKGMVNPADVDITTALAQARHQCQQPVCMAGEVLPCTATNIWVIAYSKNWLF